MTEELKDMMAARVIKKQIRVIRHYRTLWSDVLRLRVSRCVPAFVLIMSWLRLRACLCVREYVHACVCEYVHACV